MYKFHDGNAYINFPQLKPYYEKIEFTDDLQKDKELIKHLSHHLLQYASLLTA